MFYLKNLRIENTGPLNKVKIDFPFTDDKKPIPVVLVGTNGSGKTILLSSIADALMEFGHNIFSDVLPKEGTGYRYFKLSGRITQKVGTSYSFCFLNFENEAGTNFQHIDKTGQLSYDECKLKTDNLLNIELTRFANVWDDSKNIKLRSLNAKDLEKDFLNNSICFFPQYRYEIPHWFNLPKEFNKEFFKVDIKFANILNKPIYVNSSLEENIQWLLSLNLDYKWNTSSKWTKRLYEIQTQILGLVLEDDNLDYVLNTRFDPNKIAIGKLRDNQSVEIILPSLRNLSGGQSALLNMFFTIIRYSDTHERMDFEEIKGIVLIDEIDLYLHFNLKNEILPKLISYFPNVQFIFSTQSPLVLNGMNKHLGTNFSIIDLPTGNTISVDQFEEFERAYNLYNEDNQKFKTIYDELNSKVKVLQRPLIITEGKCDWKHLKTALEHFKGNGIYNDLNIDFHEFEDEVGMGDTELRKIYESLSKLNHDKKVICIFDRDNPKIIRLHPNEFEDRGNNIYSFCIPIPTGREQYNNISLEFYYTDDELKFPEPISSKRLFFSNEIQKITNLTNYKEFKLKALNSPIIEHENDKKVFDGDCSLIEDDNGDKVAISKSIFADLVKNKGEGFNNMNFDSFRSIFDIIQTIISA